ncbi:alpha/beta hydrolase [Devosia marina]|uniref:alpha/beta hydrolase n=1 Tax=Devosia marina TaxID=2683198 RepID=UPI0012F7C03B|nr:alpha/beta hydrolase [Devosia marina]
MADIISALVPKDGASRRVARGLSYGAGPRRKLDLYRPRHQSDAPLPIIVFFYGGAWNSGSRTHYGFAARALAAMGYLVVVPDYRLVPEIEYPAFLEDCAAAVGWVSDNAASYGGDPVRLVLAGHSAGAYNAACLALDPRWLAPAQRAAVVGVIGLSGPYDFYPFDGPISQRVFGQADDPRQTQPIHHVGPDAAPKLLITGGRDDLVLPRNSVNLSAALERAGVHSSLRLYPRLGHAGTLLCLSLPLRWMAPVLEDCRAFLADVTNPGTGPGDPSAGEYRAAAARQ